MKSREAIAKLKELERGATGKLWEYREGYDSSELYPVLGADISGHFDKTACTINDWKLIAHSRNQLPVLLSALEIAIGTLEDIIKCDKQFSSDPRPSIEAEICAEALAKIEGLGWQK